MWKTQEKKYTKLSTVGWLGSKVWLFKIIFLLLACSRHTISVYIYYKIEKQGDF